MRIVLYTEKSVSQCMSALNERLQGKGRFEGWVEKNGEFALGTTTKVAKRFERTTYLRGKAEKGSGCTVIRADVASGTPLAGQIVMFIGLALVVILMMGRGQAIFALAIIPAALLLYIPMAGDYENSEVLVNELQRTLKAKTKPPVKKVAAKN